MYSEHKFGKFYLSALSTDEVISRLQLTEEDFKKLYTRSFNSAKRDGNYIFYKKNIIGTEETPEYFSSVGYYLFINTALELKKHESLSGYLGSAKKLAFDDLLNIYKEASKTPRKAPNPNSDLDFEDLMAFQSKKIDTSKNFVDYQNVEDKTHKLYDKNVLLTGDFEKFGIRDNFIPLLNKLGCTVKSGVTSKLDFLICGSAPGPSKVKKANELNIPIIYEAEFYTLLNI